MKRIYQIHWRLAIAYGLLIFLSMGVVTAVLALLPPTGLSDTATEHVNGYVRRIIGITAIVVVVMSGPLAFFIERPTIRSIRALTDGAKHLANGDLKHKIEAIPSKETEELTETFNLMAVSIKQMVEDLSAEKNKLSAILATMTDGVAVIDKEDKIVLANPATENLLNVPSPRQENQRLVEMVRDHDVRRLISLARTKNELQSEEIEISSNRRHLWVVATPLPSLESEEVLMILHDLTLEQRVETTKREFVANVSHELRTPLAAVKAAVETLDQGAINERMTASRFLAGINRDVDRMTRIVEDLLELSRLDTGQANIHKNNFHLRMVIDETLERYQAKAKSKGVFLRAEVDIDLPLAIGDELKCQQVMSNLVENAIKFTGQEGEIVVKAEADDKNVVIRVTDTGIGIPQEHLPHVFERFYKIDRSRREEGSGLGLAIAKHIVQALGGDMWVSSRENEGSTFTFTLPTGTS